MLAQNCGEQTLLDERVFNEGYDDLRYSLDLTTELRLDDHDVINYASFQILAFDFLLFLDLI